MTNHPDDRDFEQFSGRFDAPVMPSAAFAASLKARVAQAPIGDVSETAQATTRLPVDAASIPARTEPAIDESWRAPRWMRTVEAAVATLIVLSLVTASVAFRQPAALWDLAFQPEVVPGPTEFNYGGDAGRTWVLGDVDPEMGGFRQEPTIDLGGGQFGGPDLARILIDNSYFFTVSGIEEDEFVRYDLDSSERLWTAPVYLSGSLASDGKRVFGMRSDHMITTDSATLVAIDFETGEIAWEGPELANRIMYSSSIALSGDAIFVTDYLGNVVAVNKADGDLLWQYPETFAVPAADEDFISGSQVYTSPEIATNDTAVFVNRPSRAILKLDRETGIELGSINLVDQYGADIITSLVQVRDQQLAITAIQAPRSEDLEAIRDFMPSSILLFDAQTLELQARTGRFDFRGNAVMTSDAMYVPLAASVEDDASLYRLDLATGKLGEPIEGVSDRWDMTLSASGNVLMATGDPSTIVFYDLTTGELLYSVELGITNMETPFDQPIQMWNSNPIVITRLGEVYVVEDDTDD